MKRYGRYAKPYFFMRIGLGLVFLWIAIDTLRNPEAWIAYMPATLPGGVSQGTALRLTAALDGALGVAFILNYAPKLTAAASSAVFAGILLTNGIDQALIRDVGLLATSLALLTWPTYRRKKSRVLSAIPFVGRKKSRPTAALDE